MAELRHLLTGDDLTAKDITDLLDLANRLKKEQKAGETHRPLSGKTLAMLFEKSSTRTRVSFEVAMVHLGGHALFLDRNSVGLGSREAVRDVGQTLSRYVDAIMIRTHAHEGVEELAQNSTVPVINGLSEAYHPCQALADLQTIAEHRPDLSGARVVFVGDGNNVARSLAIVAVKVGVQFVLTGPSAYRFEPEFEERLQTAAIGSGSYTYNEDPASAVDGADVLYTDVWTSMGQEEERETRMQAFQPYQINAELLQKAKNDAVVMHCLPAHREEEITAEVLDGSQSIVFDQAENRLHAQKAILVFLAGD